MMELYQSPFTVNGNRENWPLILFLAESGVDQKNSLEKGSGICLENIAVKLFVINNQVCCKLF